MTDILLFSDTGSLLPLLAASSLSGPGQDGLNITAAIARDSGRDISAVKEEFRETGQNWPASVISFVEIDPFASDLMIYLGEGENPYPPLPGIPPVLIWRIAARPDKAGIREFIEEFRARFNGLVAHGYLESLLQARQRSELVLDNLHEGIIAHDLNRCIFFFNRAAERITGYKRHEVLGRDCHQVFPGNFCGSQCSFCQLGGEPFLPGRPYSLNFAGPEGDERPLEMSITPIVDSGARIRGVVASFRDLSPVLTGADWRLDDGGFCGIIGRTPRMKRVYQSIRELADSNAPVLINGESGTGKELVAVAIHRKGRRRERLFVPVNCGALPENLLESELFGHVRGAFTGAIRDKKGRFELADGGTIFLDEIGDISQAMQVKLLRVLQNGTFQRLGGEDMVKVDVRVVSATHKNLAEEIAAGRFREDLFYRLCVVPLNLPPLRERKEDLPLLVRHFIRQIAEEEGRPEISLADDALEILGRWDWPGNVRELQNVIRYIMVRCRDERARPHHLPENLRSGRQTGLVTSGVPPRKRRKKLSVELVTRTLKTTGGNRLKAAKLLGVGRATLYRFFKEHPEVFHGPV